MAENTLVVTLQAGITKQQVHNVFKEFSLARFAVVNGKAYIQFNDANDIETISFKFGDDTRIEQLNGSEYDLVDKDFVWQKVVPEQAHKKEQVHQKKQADLQLKELGNILAIKNCDSSLLKKLKAEDVITLFSTNFITSVRRVAILPQAHEVIVQIGDSKELELLDQAFENYKVSAFGNQAHFDIDTEISKQKFQESLRKQENNGSLPILSKKTSMEVNFAKQTKQESHSYEATNAIDEMSTVLELDFKSENEIPIDEKGIQEHEKANEQRRKEQAQQHEREKKAFEDQLRRKQEEEKAKLDEEKRIAELKEKAESERLEKEKKERERLEQEKQERQRLQREENQKKERQRQEQLKLEQERLDRQRRIRQQQERVDLEKKEIEKLRQKQLELAQEEKRKEQQEQIRVLEQQKKAQEEKRKAQEEQRKIQQELKEKEEQARKQKQLEAIQLKIKNDQLQRQQRVKQEREKEKREKQLYAQEQIAIQKAKQADRKQKLEEQSKKQAYLLDSDQKIVERLGRKKGQNQIPCQLNACNWQKSGFMLTAFLMLWVVYLYVF